MINLSEKVTKSNKTKKVKKREKTQITNVRNVRGFITDSADIKKENRGIQQMILYKFSNLDDTD